MARTRLHRAAIVAACVVVSAALCGCTVLVTEPARPTVAVRTAGLTFADAMDHLDRVRASMIQGRSQVDLIDASTRGAVGLGVGGAAITALTKGSSDVMLGLLTLAGSGYAINQTSMPAVQASIYSKGLDTLDCIERTGGRVFRETGDARANLIGKRADLNAAINRVSADLDETRRQPDDPVPAELSSQAERAVVAGRALQKSVNEFVNATDVADEMYHAANKTVSTVNEQLRSRAPNLDEIARAGSMLTGFVASNSKVGADALAARSAVGSALTTTTQSRHRMASQISNDLANLRRVVAEVQELLPPAGHATSELVGSCKSQLPGQGAFAVTPAGPIQLSPGGEAYSLRVEADRSIGHGFNGPTPSAQQLIVSQTSPRTFSLAAPAGAKAGKYLFYVYESVAQGGRVLPDIEVAVIAATDSAPRSAPTPLALQKRQGLTFPQRRKLIGLGTEVQAETDTAWLNRVQKLDNCFKIMPSDGKLGDKLVSELLKSEPVNSFGDCPKARPSANAGAQGGGGSGNAVPVPAPPNPGANAAIPQPPKPAASN